MNYFGIIKDNFNFSQRHIREQSDLPRDLRGSLKIDLVEGTGNGSDSRRIELEIAEVRIAVTEPPRTRATVTPAAQVTGTFRTRSRSSIYSIVPRFL